MAEQQNLQIVRDAFEAFGRGDIPALLRRLDEYVEWEPVMGAAGHVPIAGKRMGKEAVAEFFEILDQNITFDIFQPEEFIAQGDLVVTLGHYEGRARTTERTFSGDWAMVMTVRNDKVIRFREYVSTSSIDAAFDDVGV
jgi:hypothetical protein